MIERAVVTSFQIKDQGRLLATFKNRVTITFVPMSNGTVGLDSIVVTHKGKQVAYCNVQKWESTKGTRGAAVFGGTVDNEVAMQIGRYCLAAYNKLRTNSKIGESLSLKDHILALDITKAGLKCYRAMKRS